MVGVVINVVKREKRGSSQAESGKGLHGVTPSKAYIQKRNR